MLESLSVASLGAIILFVIDIENSINLIPNIQLQEILINMESSKINFIFKFYFCFYAYSKKYIYFFIFIFLREELKEILVTIIVKFYLKNL